MRNAEQGRALLPSIVALGVMAVVAAVLMASPWEPRGASAGTTDISSVSCADVYLVELEQPVANPKPFGLVPGDPVPLQTVGLFGLPPQNVAISLTRTQHNTIDNTTNSVGTTYNAGIPGVIAGTLPFPNPVRCARVDKVVATVDSVTDPGNTPTLGVTETGGNGPVAGMLVYWRTNNTTNQGFYVVTAASPGSVTLERTTATCNEAPTIPLTALGELLSCVPENKGLQVIQNAGNWYGESKPTTFPLAYANSDVVKDSFFFGEPPRPGDSTLDKGTNTVTSISCSANTGGTEGEAQNNWTRTELYTVVNKDASEKVPSYGIAQLFNPTEPKTCANTPETNRSTNVTVVWPLDSVSQEGPIENWDSDYDKDGCLDWEELAWPLPVQNGSAGSFTGGRDPFNPNDCDRNFSSIWGIEIESLPITLDVDQTLIPGGFFRCRADVQHNKTSGNNELTARIFCYTDFYDDVEDFYLAVNPAAMGGSPHSCPTLDLTICGDGLSGSPFPIGSAPPPPPYGDLDDHHVVLTGSYSKSTDTISLEGCYDGIDNELFGPNAYIRASIDALTGHGTADVWLTREDCTKPAEPPDRFSTVNFGYPNSNIQIVELSAKGVKQYDFDLDGCTDKAELSDDFREGGLRDPYNPHDHFDVTGDKRVRVADINAVVGQFNIDEGDPGYEAIYDRLKINGGNAWNVGEPNGRNRVDDITNVVKQFNQDCDSPPS